MAATNVTATPVPAGDTIGGISQLIYHVMITSTGAGSFSFNHGLSYTPTWALAIAQLTDGTAPTSANAGVGFCPADTTATVLAINVGAAGTFHVLYG
jgi:hypothetical protein